MDFEKVQNTESVHELDWVIPTDITIVDVTVSKLIAALEDADWKEDSDEANAIQLSFREALINSIAHGNLGVVVPDGSTENIQPIAQREQEKNPSEKNVYVHVEIKPNEVTIIMRDEGNGFNLDEVPDPTAEEALLKSKGRGIKTYMMGFMDSVKYENGGRRLVMTKKRNQIN